MRLIQVLALAVITISKYTRGQCTQASAASLLQGLAPYSNKAEKALQFLNIAAARTNYGTPVNQMPQMPVPVMPIQNQQFVPSALLQKNLPVMPNYVPNIPINQLVNLPRNVVTNYPVNVQVPAVPRAPINYPSIQSAQNLPIQNVATVSSVPIVPNVPSIPVVPMPCDETPPHVVSPFLPAASPMSGIAPPTSNALPPLSPREFRGRYLRKIPIPPPCL